jgi:signal transduction histidine kinase
MKISTKARFATHTTLGTIALIAAMIGWAVAEVDEAGGQRRQTVAVARVLNDLRLVTFEYILHRTERARLQERDVAARLDTLLAAHPQSDPDAAGLLAELRERSTTTHRLFSELLGPSVDMNGADHDAVRRYEAQLSNRLLLLHQENLADTFRLSDYSNARIDAAQRRLIGVIVAGLLLIALTTAMGAWLIHRKVLAPMHRLELATREVAATNWNFKLDIGGDDEVGELARDFNAMIDALRASFAQIERSNHELAVLNKEIEAFSYSVSHDLRAPLRSMDGFSLALLEDYGDKLDDEARDSLNRIRAASQRMGRLIDELLGLSRVTRTELAVKSVNLSAVTREIVEALQQRQPERHVKWDIDDNITVQADRALMQIAMQNLLENAWKFTAKTDRPVIRVGTVEHEGRTTCFVADNGVGFDMAYADKLFGAFQRLHHESEFSGTGIGLAIVQRIIRRHDGQIWVRAQPGEGATFFFNVKEPKKHERSESDSAG